jgi:DNA repair protein RecO (recombination protein O)
MIKSVPGWLIHKQWSGDTSTRVYFFTSELGLVNCLYKGGRTLKKQVVLQPYTPLWINLEARYQCYYAQSVECSSSTLHLRATSLFSAIYLNELIYYTLKPFIPEIELFQAYLFTLNQLSMTNDRLMIEALLRRFEWTLLHTCGHGFSLTTEVDTYQLVHSHKYYQFIPGKGLVVAQKGIPGEHLLALAADDLTTPDYLKSAKMIMRKAIDYLLGGREIKARTLYIN